jgi:hypothetical protein
MLQHEMGMPIRNLGAQHYGAGFYPELYNVVSQVQDQVVSIQFALSRMPASQRDYQQIGQRLLDASA